MDRQDLLSSVLDECGLDFNDMTAQVIPEEVVTPKVLVPNVVKTPTIGLMPNHNHNNNNIYNNNKISVTTYSLLRPTTPKTQTFNVNYVVDGSTVSTSKAGQVVYRPTVPTIATTTVSSLIQPSVSLLYPNKMTITANNSLLNKTQMTQMTNNLMKEEDKLEMDEEDDEFATVETFNNYMPSKLKCGIKHPDPVVETASLSSVLPPDVYYRLEIPEEVIDSGKLSALQLESIVYASQQHDVFLSDGSRAGFLVGDGAGVGKGRTIAGIIHENYLKGRKRAVWLSVSTDLKYDAERDLYDIGAKIDVHLLNKFKYGYRIHSEENDKVKRGVIFATYSSLISESTTLTGKYKSRFGQLVQWCGEDFDGVIVFDECHKAKNLFPSSGSGKPTKTGLAVLEIQKKLPKARIVYASATGASEPKNMGYMIRLGIWGKGTPFEEFAQFVNAVEKRGVGAMELVAIDIKMRGMYLARQLSFEGVQFRIEEVPLDKDFIKLYNKCTDLWVSAKLKFDKALELMDCDNNLNKTIWTQFWASHQRFFKYLCIASKVKFAVNFVKEALRDSKSVVIGLQSTGEARTLEQLEDNGGELSDFVSTAKAVFQSLIEKHFPAPNRKKLLRLLGRDTSFFDDLGITLKRNANDEIVAAVSNDSKYTTNNKNKSFSSDESSESDFESVGSDDSNESDDDLSISDDFSDDSDSDSERRKRKSNFSDIFLNRKPKKLKKDPKMKKVKKERKQKKKMIKIEDQIKALNCETMSADAGDNCAKMKDSLLQELERLNDKLPPNTLDQLIDELGGPDNVAEMTGRKGRIVCNEEGNVQYQTRCENDVPQDMLNLVEKQRFMDDEKRVAIISEAASSGISLHADKRAKNKLKRVHITVELPWSADRAIQQFGRTHRSNQEYPPEYVFLISELAGEKRFASIVAKRLESLGALTHGDRRATDSRDLSQYNIDNRYGRIALEIVMKSIAQIEDPIVSPPNDYKGDFFEDCRQGLAGVGIIQLSSSGAITLDKDYSHMTKFLNRLLGLRVEIQNALFKYFSDTMDAVIRQAKRTGRYDSGIINLSSDVGNIEQMDEISYFIKTSGVAMKIQLHQVVMDRGLEWDKTLELYNKSFDSCSKDDIKDMGFYMTSNNQNTRKSVFLALPDFSDRNQFRKIYRVYKPNIGLQSKCETISGLKEKGVKKPAEEVKALWKELYDLSDTRCSHILWNGSCKRLITKQMCNVGVRKHKYCILSGAVLTIWPELEKAIPYLQSHRLQIVRLKTGENSKFIGPMVPPAYVEVVKQTLQQLQTNGIHVSSALKP
ncbi:protein strawberry notch homolog 1-like [Oppia nitens]|uniref:protein strawberry notch homolog 1-like n=1 Tax=Oppia nitens TaxID=1686743 RepID=UPI0023DA1034|nr:protein strawberry notch homolog 1-like [Oppia nitens]